MTSVRRGWGDEHARLNALFYELANAVEGASQPALQGKWVQFEAGLMAHLDAEEQYLFPLIEVEHPTEVQALLDEHEGIRRGIAQLRMFSGAQATRKRLVERLVEQLRAHAVREDRTLYGEVDGTLQQRPQRLALVEFLTREAEGRAREWSDCLAGWRNPA